MPKIENEKDAPEKIIKLNSIRGETRIDVFRRLHKEMVNDPNFKKETEQRDLELLRKIENEKLPPDLRVVKKRKE